MEFKKILQYLPYHKAYCGLLPILIMQNKLDEAESYGREHLKMKPTCAEANFYLGNIFRKKGDYPKAIKYFSKAIDLKPEGATLAYEYLAEVFKKSGSPDKAIETLYKAIDNSPKEKTAQAHAYLGFLLSTQGKYDQALKELELALIINPEYAKDKLFQENLKKIKEKAKP